MTNYSRRASLLLVFLTVFTGFASAQEQKPALSAEELAKKLSNPVASLISVPFQNNTDIGIGQYKGSKNTLNFQPVIPIKLSPKLNLIARVVLPFVTQYNIDTIGSYQCGLSDAVASAFLSPAEAKKGLTWGVGPVFLLPTGTENLLSARKFGVGPTALVLYQSKGWTLGALVNQLWSVAGDKNRPDVNQGFLQPFLAFNWKSGAGIGLNAEITQNWHAQTTTAFLNPSISAVTKLGKQTISMSIGPHIQVAAPAGTKAQFGVRASLVFVFPK